MQVGAKAITLQHTCNSTEPSTFHIIVLQYTQCWKFPQVRQSEADNFEGGPGTFCWFFFQFYVYDLRFKAWGPTTFWAEFQTLHTPGAKLHPVPLDTFWLVYSRARTRPNFCDRLIACGSELIIELDSRFLLSKIHHRDGSKVDLIDLPADIRQVSHHSVT